MKNKKQETTIRMGNTLRQVVSTIQQVPLPRSKRGQTSIDLLLAVVIFFSAIGLLIGQNPAVFFPGSIGASDTATTSDRIAQDLISTELSYSGETTLSHSETVNFLETATTDSEHMETVFSLPAGQGIQIELQLDTTNDPREIPPIFEEDNNFVYDVTEDNDIHSIVIESESFDGSGTAMTRYATLDDRRVEITVTVGRHV